MHNKIKEIIPNSLKKMIRVPLNKARSKKRERQSYEKISELGKKSNNQWIRKSSGIGGWLFEGEHEFLWELATYSKKGNILEVGTWMGKSACILAGACKETSPTAKVFCIDPFTMEGTEQQVKYHNRLVGKLSSTYDIFLNNSEDLGFRDMVIPIAACSHQVLPYINTTLRLAFIDGAHDYINAKRDADLIIPMLCKEGIVAFHDAENPVYPELKRLMGELSERGDLKPYKTVNTIVAFQKIG